MALEKKESYDFLDGLRGLAALQVVFLHYFSCFLPVAADAGSVSHFGWETGFSHSILSYAIDGYSAVYLFFVMSGFVLAQSFIKSELSVWRAIAKRFVRLFVPVAVAALIAAALFPLIYPARAAAHAISASQWLAGVYQNPMSLRSVMKDVLLSSMLVGYNGVSLMQMAFPDAAKMFSPQGFALNAPMWTLHGEFWGSMLVLFLAVTYRRLPPVAFGMLLAVTLYWTGTSQLSLFVIGFGMYLGRHRLLGLRGKMRVAAAIALIGAGVYICVHRGLPRVLALDVWLVNHSNLRAYNDAHFESSLGAVMVLLGVMLLPLARRLLSASPLHTLGRLSFSVYLLHFPIMLSLGCAVFALLAPHGYLMAVGVSIVTGTTATLFCANWFERFVDAPTIQLARKLAATGGRGKITAASCAQKAAGN
ncbi:MULTISPECIES: acyltransferase family protein [Paraburkholderia]|uniref:acyltransferase family protein n=1 Tax=Paraburkholderia TaxID=1822464 RepID=UPI002AB63504|nr:acyltransferase [Paraburkholderia tropica]